jgi:hypothetical protein
LTIPDQFAEKLLANADRWYDRAVAYRDAIDLGYLVRANGSIPPRAIAKAEAAYGTDVARSVFAVLERLSVPAGVEHAATGLGMSPDEISNAASRLRDAASKAWSAPNSP